MWNWGQSPFPRIKFSYNHLLQHVEKGTVPNSTLLKLAIVYALGLLVAKLLDFVVLIL